MVEKAWKLVAIQTKLLETTQTLFKAIQKIFWGSIQPSQHPRVFQSGVLAVISNEKWLKIKHFFADGAAALLKKDVKNMKKIMKCEIF